MSISASSCHWSTTSPPRTSFAAALALLLSSAPTAQDEPHVHTNRDAKQMLRLPKESDAFGFVIFGDRTGGPASGIKILEQAVEDTNLLDPDLVMTVGDLIQGYNQAEPWLEQMREFRGVMEGLAMPWYPVAGNHDVYWRGPNKPPEEHEQRYEEHFGPLWYAFPPQALLVHRRCTRTKANPDTGREELLQARRART